VPLPSAVRGALAGLTPIALADERIARARGLTRRQLHVARAWHLDLLPTLDLLRGGLVLDVGAHEGLWTRDVLELVPDAKVIACEPQDDLRAKIEQRFAGDGRVTIERRALTDTEGEQTFHLLGASVNGSLRAPRPGMEDLYGRGWKTKRTVTVPTTTVDLLTAGTDVALLKIDVQGAEREVLAGARETLRRTAAVMLEVTFISHYDGDATFADLHAQMTEAGFLLTGISEPARSPMGAMLTSDAAYISRHRLDPHFRQS
jgi:FkbM family methyltransferase